MAKTSEKQREYVRGHYSRNKDYYKSKAAQRAKESREKLNLLKSGPCADCGGSFPPCVMDFDHRDPSTKLGEVATLLKTRGWPTVLAEIEKCDLVCANCHRIRTYIRM